MADSLQAELRASAILDGQIDQGDPAIVYLSMGNSACTGSVIDPRVVLTAKHCVEGVSADWVEVYAGVNPYGNDARALASYGDITSIEVFDNGWSIEGVDIALLISGRDLDVDPVPYLRDESAVYQGDLVEAAGYGQSDDWRSPDGNKRRGSGSVLDNWGVEVSTTPITCYGDSGGPLFDGQGVVIGITSRGTNETCSAGDDIYTNVGHFANWIGGFVTNPAPLPGDDPVEPDPDPDPDPEDPGTDPGTDPGDDPGTDPNDPAPDPDSGDDPLPGDDRAGFGDACTEGEQCGSNACVALPGGDGYCTETCSSDSCPYGFACNTTAQGSFCFLEDGAGGGGGGGEGGDVGPDGTAGLAGSCAATPGAPTGEGAAVLALFVLALSIAARRRETSRSAR